MKKTFAGILMTLLVAAPLFGQEDPNARTKTGATIGGIAGAIVGAVIGNNRGHHSSKRGAIVGGLAGTAAGAIVGHMIDNQERELRQIQGVNVQRTANDELNVTVQNEVLFDFNSSALRPESRSALREMANVFERYPDTTIRVEGFTDSIGSASYNDRLSERRADRVAGYLMNLGVNDARIRALGFGESQPRATNSTASGRQLNRRVEIHIKANAA